MPYPGFKGFDIAKQNASSHVYIRKHNPLLVNYTITVGSNTSHLSLVKNFTSNPAFAAKTLSQWMFGTPNMTTGSNDPNIKIAANETVLMDISSKYFQIRCGSCSNVEDSSVQRRRGIVPSFFNPIPGLRLGLSG
jgi:hypothetical protein